jgi:hypothetical protein
MAVAGTATKTMEGGLPVGAFEPEELDGIGRHMDQRGLALDGAVHVVQRIAAQIFSIVLPDGSWPRRPVRLDRRSLRSSESWPDSAAELGQPDGCRR